MYGSVVGVVAPGVKLRNRVGARQVIACDWRRYRPEIPKVDYKADQRSCYAIDSLTVSLRVGMPGPPDRWR